MPIKFKVNCKTCIACKGNHELLHRIYQSQAYVKGGEALTKIALEEGLPYQSLYWHTKKHQAVTDEDLTTFEMKQIARKETRLMVERALSTSDIRARITQELEDALDSEDFKQMAADKKISLLLRAAKDTDDLESKTKGQNLDAMKMMAGYRSGEHDLDVRPEAVEAEVVE